MTTQTKGSFYAQTGPTYEGTNPSSSSNDGEIPVVFIAGADGTFDTIDLPITFGCSVVAATLVSDAPGDVVIDVQLAPYAGFPGSLASICSSTKPTLTSAQAYQDTALTGWTKAVPANSVLRFTPSGVSGIQRATLTLQIT